MVPPAARGGAPGAGLLDVLPAVHVEVPRAVGGARVLVWQARQHEGPPRLGALQAAELGAVGRVRVRAASVDGARWRELVVAVERRQARPLRRCLRKPMRVRPHRVGDVGVADVAAELGLLGRGCAGV